MTEIDMATPSAGWALAETNGGYGARFVLHTTDGGRRWRDVTPIAKPSPWPPLVADFLNASRAWVVIQKASRGRPRLTYRMYWTDTGGRSWKQVWSGRRRLQPRTLHFRDPRHGVFVLDGCCAMSRDWVSVQATSDAGRSWHQLVYGCADACGSRPAPKRGQALGWCDPTGFRFEGRLIGYRAAISAVGPCLDVTTDGGRSWRAIDLPKRVASPYGGAVSAPAIVPRDGLAVGLQVGPRYLVHGQERQRLFLAIIRRGHADVRPAPGPATRMPPAPIDFVDPLHGWLVEPTLHGGELLRTSDGGRSWTRLRPWSPSATTIDFLDRDLGWAPSGPNGILVTHDGGLRWRRLRFEVVR